MNLGNPSGCLRRGTYSRLFSPSQPRLPCFHSSCSRHTNAHSSSPPAPPPHSKQQQTHQNTRSLHLLYRGGKKRKRGEKAPFPLGCDTVIRGSEHLIPGVNVNQPGVLLFPKTGNCILPNLLEPPPLPLWKTFFVTLFPSPDTLFF